MAVIHLKKSELRKMVNESVQLVKEELLAEQTTALRESIKTKVDGLTLEQLQELDEGFFSQLGAGLKSVGQAAVGGVQRGAQAVGQAAKNAGTAVATAYKTGAAGAAIADIQKQVQPMLATINKYYTSQYVRPDMKEKLKNLSGVLVKTMGDLINTAKDEDRQEPTPGQPPAVPTGQSVITNPAAAGEPRTAASTFGARPNTMPKRRGSV